MSTTDSKTNGETTTDLSKRANSFVLVAVVDMINGSILLLYVFFKIKLKEELI